jgi:hypothetical protein
LQNSLYFRQFVSMLENIALYGAECMNKDDGLSSKMTIPSKKLKKSLTSFFFCIFFKPCRNSSELPR